MATVSITVDAAKVEGLFDAFLSAISPQSVLRFLNTDAQEYWEQDLQNRFLKKGDRKATWEPLAASTQDIRVSLGFSPNWTNARTYDMYEWLFKSIGDSPQLDGFGASMTFPGNPPDTILEEKLTTAQQGKATNSLGYGPTPARPVIAADGVDLQSMLVLLSNHIILHVQGMLL